MNEYECWLADKAYGSKGKLVVPPKRARDEADIGIDGQCINDLHTYYRVTIEHVIGFVKRLILYSYHYYLARFAIARVYRGVVGKSKNSFENLGRFMMLTFELCNLHHAVNKTTKRLLNVLVMNEYGENILRNVDFCDEIVNLRRWLNHQHLAVLTKKRKTTSSAFSRRESTCIKLFDKVHCFIFLLKFIRFGFMTRNYR